MKLPGAIVKALTNNSTSEQSSNKSEKLHSPKVSAKKTSSKIILKWNSLEDGREQLRKYNKKSNNIPKVCLNFRTPNEVLNDYLSVM